MLSVTIKIGAKVRRKHDNGMDTPGAVMRLQDSEAMVYWPTDQYYEILPVSKLELYNSIPATA